MSGPQGAIRHFQRALELDPNHRPAILGLAILSPEEIDLQALEPRELGIVEAVAHRKEQDWKAVAGYEEALADWEAGSLLHSEAVRMRVGWRLDTGDPQHARDALALLDQLIPRHKGIANLLLRAEASAGAGLDDFGWASLDRVLTRLKSRPPRSRAYAIRALNSSRRLDNIAGAQRIIRGLEAIAGFPTNSR
jgi:hypothetical protein